MPPWMGDRHDRCADRRSGRQKIASRSGTDGARARPLSRIRINCLRGCRQHACQQSDKSHFEICPCVRFETPRIHALGGGPYYLS